MQAVKAASAAIAAVEAASQVVAGLVAKPEKIIILLQAKSVHLPYAAYLVRHIVIFAFYRAYL